MIASPLAAGVANVLESEEFLWASAALIGLLLLGAIAFSLIERWRKRQLTDSPAADIKQLTSFRAMFERGELTQEEYDRIKAKEAERMKKKLAAKPAAPGKGGEAPPPQPAPQAPPPPETETE
jgi:hypothetical protein